MAISVESITPSALAATDRILVRRGAGPADHTMELVDPPYAVGPNSVTNDRVTNATMPVVRMCAAAL